VISIIACQFFSCSSIPVEDFIGHPISSSDHETLRPMDDGSSTIDLAESVFVNGARYRAVHINNNGVLNFRAPTGAYAPRKFPITGNDYIAVFWSDLNTNECSCAEIRNYTVYYKEFTVKDPGSSCVFEHIDRIVESSSDFKILAGCSRQISFETKWAFEVTWRELQYHSRDCTLVSEPYTLMSLYVVISY
jgi:hypothetical protein